MNGFPTSAMAILGCLTLAFSAVLTYAGKLISELRSDNKALQDKIIDKVVPAMEASASASQALSQSTQRIMEAVVVAEDRRRR